MSETKEMRQVPLYHNIPISTHISGVYRRNRSIPAGKNTRGRNAPIFCYVFLFFNFSFEVIIIEIVLLARLSALKTTSKGFMCAVRTGTCVRVGLPGIVLRNTCQHGRVISNRVIVMTE